MSKRYDFNSIERKWQKRWAEKDEFAVFEQAERKKFYMLEMLPYPSGELHLGHVRNYSLGDSIARLKKLQGFNIMHPIGWDAFGLPAENAAIKHQVAPETWTLNNISRMKTQLKRLGYSYDWNREIATCLPDYYRWNQWLFLKMFEKGLAYKKRGQVNWCEQCQTVLANEQVVNGGCWRDGSPVLLKELDQWYLRISDYADELLTALDDLDEWPENVVTMQRNWIGKSHGARIEFRLEDGRPIEVFTTRIDTIFGATFVVLAPEHELVRGWLGDPEYGPAISTFLEEVRRLDPNTRTDDTREKRGVFTGRYAVNPFNGEKVPVWIADFVLMGYGTGAIMAVPAHDERDFEFARKYGIEIRRVIRPEGEPDDLPLEKAFTEPGILLNSGRFSGLPTNEAQKAMAQYAAANGFGEATVSFRLKDWGISRQRYWGTPIPIIHCPECGAVGVPEEQLPVLLPKMEGIQLGGSPLEKVEEFYRANCPKCGREARRETDTMDTFIDSSWYFYRYVDPRNDQAPFGSSPVKYWFPVDIYIGGVEHAVLHLIYMRFFSKVMRDLGLVRLDEPVRRLFTQGMVLKEGAKMSKSKGNTVAPDEIVEKYGADALRLFIQFCAPPEGELDWNEKGLDGCFRFLNRYWRIVERFQDRIRPPAPIDEASLDEGGRKLLRKLHQTIRKVTEDIERVHQNTAVSAIMELLNTVYEVAEQDTTDLNLISEVLEKMTIILSPFCPHIAEEVWEWTGHTGFVSASRWPDFDPELAREEEIEIVFQVNGKIRSRFYTTPDVTREALEEAVLRDPKIRSRLEGKTLRKVIVVPGRLVNLVVS